MSYIDIDNDDDDDSTTLGRPQKHLLRADRDIAYSCCITPASSVFFHEFSRYKCCVVSTVVTGLVFVSSLPIVIHTD